MNSVPPSAFRNPVHLLAIGLGSGAAPKAPGTFGTLAAVVLYLPLSLLAPLWYGLVVLVAALIGIYLCGKTSRDWGVHDHGAIVWDEFVGYWITMFLIPVTWYWARWQALCCFACSISGSPGRYVTLTARYTVGWASCWTM